MGKAFFVIVDPLHHNAHLDIQTRHALIEFFYGIRNRVHDVDNTNSSKRTDSGKNGEIEFLVQKNLPIQNSIG